MLQKIVLGIFIATNVLLPVAAIAEVGAAFNTVNKLQNVSQGQSGWHKSTTANPSDFIAFYVYFNNVGSENAANTVIKNTLPAEMSYIPGTTKLYSNTVSGQKLDDTITTTGVNLGTVSPGSGNSGYVVFQGRVKSDLAAGNYTLVNRGTVSADNASAVSDTSTITVTVAEGTPLLSTLNKISNSTRGDTSWSKTVSANPGDVVEFYVYITNAGTASATSVKVSDVLPSNLTYIPNTTKKYTGSGSAKVADTITTSGISIGDLSTGAANSVYFTFQAQVSSNLTSGSYTLTNTGKVVSDNAGTKTDTATVTVTVAAPNGPGLATINKVQNISQNQSGWHKSTTANAGEFVAFYIYANNIGDQNANNVKISDQLPNDFEYVPGTTKLYTSSTASQKLDDGVAGAGVNIGTLTPGASNSKYVVFQARVLSDIAVGTHDYINMGKVSADSVSTKIDTSTITVTKVGVASFNVLNKVANSTKGDTVWSKTVSANPGDVVEFYVYVNNNGDTTANDTTIKDALPSYLSYISGTTKIYTGSGSTKLDDGVTNGGISIGDVKTNQANSKYVVFQALISKDIPAGSYTLTNTAKVKASNVTEVTDSSTITINVPITEADFEITNKVANSTKGDTTWSKSVEASPNDVVEFSIYVNNIGGISATNTMVRNVLPIGLTYVPGTTKLYRENSNEKLSDGITSATGINIGTLNQGKANSIYIVFQARIASDLASGTYSKTDSAYVRADNAITAWDTSTVVIKVAQVKGVNISLSTKVSNLTADETSWKSTTNAQAGDELEFLISFKNTGTQTAKNLKVKDILPAELAYRAGSTKLYLGKDAITMPDTITSTGIIISQPQTSDISVFDLTPGSNGYLTFKIMVNDINSSKVVTNTAIATADDGVNVQSSLDISLSKKSDGTSPSGNLPKSGASTAVLLTLFAVVSTAYLAIRRKEAIALTVKKLLTRK